MIGIISDCHVANHKRHGGPVVAGINRRCRHILNALEAAVERAHAAGCTALVVAGDLFDTTNPPQQIVAEVQRIFRVAADAGMRVHNLLGNHDMVSTAEGDHALGPLAPVGPLYCAPGWVSTEQGDFAFMVPFQPGPAVDWLPKVMKEHLEDQDVPKGSALILHLGLSDSDTPSFIRHAHDSVPADLVKSLCSDYGFAAAFSGNWHWHRVHSEKPLVVQVGTLAPTGFDNPGFIGHGTLLLWDGKEMQVETIPGPRFLKVNYGEDWPESPGCNVYVEMTAKPSDISSAVGKIQELVEDGFIEAGEAVHDAAEVKKQTRRAATLARSADTLDESVSAFVENMPLADGVQRAEVLAKVRGYLTI